MLWLQKRLWQRMDFAVHQRDVRKFGAGMTESIKSWVRRRLNIVLTCL